MDSTTYADQAVVSLINEHFVALNVDQDSRPDLSLRYQNYGWPATIIFSPNGTEIVKQAGYVRPAEMKSLLTEVVKRPNSVQFEKKSKVVFNGKASLSAFQRKELVGRFLFGYDGAKGGWGSGHKFLDWDTVEFCLTNVDRSSSGMKGDLKVTAKKPDYLTMAESTLRGEQCLIDPVWGGVYQYSTDGDWVHPHFEKIMQMQAENMRIFAFAGLLLNNDSYFKSANDIRKFLSAFLLSPEGAFYTSMDADLVKGLHSGEYFAGSDEQRRKLGLPKIDTHMYARENGWAINGLVNLYDASANQNDLDMAICAANWVVDNRKLDGGGFSHDAKDSAGPYLDDTLAVGRAFLSLYAATGNRSWFDRAERANEFIDKHFKVDPGGGKAAGFASSDVTVNSYPPPQPNLDENVMVARFANLLFQYSGRPLDKTVAEAAMRYLATPAIAKDSGIYSGGILLADHEISSAPSHITVVGRKDDPLAKALVQAALKYPSGYKVVEWWDRSEGPLPHSDVEFPHLDKAAAFACSNERCSAPVYDPLKLRDTVDSLGSK